MKLEASFLKQFWEEAREGVNVNLHRGADELQVLVESER